MKIEIQCCLNTVHNILFCRPCQHAKSEFEEENVKEMTSSLGLPDISFAAAFFTRVQMINRVAKFQLSHLYLNGNSEIHVC